MRTFEEVFAMLGPAVDSPMMSCSQPQSPVHGAGARRPIGRSNSSDSFGSIGTKNVSNKAQNYKILQFDGIDRIVVQNTAAFKTMDALQQSLSSLHGQLRPMKTFALSRKCLVIRHDRISRARVTGIDYKEKFITVRIIDIGESETISADK